MNKLKEQVKIIINQIDETTILLEQCKDKEAYASMSQVIQLLNPILPSIIQNENNQIYIDQNNFIFTLNQALEAMEMRDNLLLADYLQYELKELLMGVINQ